MNVSDFTNQITTDRSWRLRELSEIVRASDEGNDLRKGAISRAAVPVLYAHWEGHFIYAANAYVNYVCAQRLMLSSLKDEFWVLSMRRKYKPQQISGDVSFSSFLTEIRSEPDRSLKRGTFEKIHGASNLKSTTLIQCCKAVGIPYTEYETYFDFIDTKLLKSRNFIAHGESLRFDRNEIPDYREKVVELIRLTGTLFENSAATKAYLK